VMSQSAGFLKWWILIRGAIQAAWGGATRHENGDSAFEGSVGGCPSYGLDRTSPTGHPPAPAAGAQRPMRIPIRDSEGAVRPTLQGVPSLTVGARMSAIFKRAAIPALAVVALCILDDFVNLQFIREATAQDSSEVYKRVYNGWKWWHVYCYRCHGADAVGTTLAPNLTDPGRKLASEEFLQIVRNGTPQKGMPAWDQLLNDKQITEIYTYVRARTEKLLPRGRPDEVGPNGGPWIPPAGWDAAVPTSAPKTPEAIASTPTSEWTPYIQGNPKVGEALFHNLQGKAACGSCHVVNGKGKAVGPDLSKIGNKPPQYLVESILKPSAQIVPGYESVQIVTKKGRHIAGIKKKEDNSTLQVADSQGKLNTVLKDEIQQNEKSTTSLMPDNFQKILTVEDFHDLLAYLLMLK